MGLAGRKKVVSEFDRQFVVDAYIHEINKILTKKNNVSVKETIQEGF